MTAPHFTYTLVEILGVILEQELHDIDDSSTLYMHPGDETFVKTLESAAAVSMEIPGVILEQESHICDNPALYIHPGVGTFVRPRNLQQLFPWRS